MKNTVALLLSLVAVIAAFISCGDESQTFLNDEPQARLFRGSYEANEYGFIPCENAETLYQSAVHHLPIRKIDSHTELEVLKEHTRASEDFFEYINEFDEAFFESNILLAVYFSSGSGSYRYYMSNLYIKEDALTVGISQEIIPPDVCVTDDIAYWIAVIELEREKIADVENFDAINETSHSYYASEGSIYSPMLTLDETSKEYYFVYFSDKKRNEIYGHFELNEDSLTLKADGQSNNIKFTVGTDALIFSAKGSSKEIGSSVADKTVLKKLR